ncbi:hypothetical protein D9M68_724840 [compost metagenome]
MQVDEGLDDGEAQPRAALAAAGGIDAGLNGGLHLVGDAGALIFDDEQHAIGALADGEADFPARRREARGIGEQVIQHLHDARAIGDEGRHAPFDIDDEIDRPLARNLGEGSR